ncbi:energy-coupling factor transporter transmembrane component T family protein [Ensifer soli]|uniref:energy-coupling factor transporter transmembrane component T family protein n=1 Tax=Ciceribacter sp. sgz301302 TaxID=3342379 RepID=UPI0035B777CA
MLNGLNVEGDTALHRLGVTPKLLGLLLCGLVLFASRSFLILGPAFLVALAAYATTGLSFRDGLRRLVPVLLTILVLAVATAWLNSPREAAETVLRLTALVLLAGAITATTETGAFIAAITRSLAPFERLGLVRAADVGLAFGLVMRFVPEIFDRYESLKEAHRARGLALKPLSLIGPLIILTLKDADTIAMAIDARGLRRRVGE